MSATFADDPPQVTKSPFTKEEQIQAILSDSTGKMVRDFADRVRGIDRSGFLKWLATVDATRFFVVTAEELQEYVEAHGFPPSRVEENGGLPGDKLVVDKVREGYYETYVVERDKKDMVRTFPSLSEARADIVKRLMILMRVRLNLQPYSLKS